MGQTIPDINGGGPLGILAFLWYDCQLGHVETQLITEGGNRRFVVSFQDAQYYTCVQNCTTCGGEGGSQYAPECPMVNIQVHLVESDYSFEVHYINAEPDPTRGGGADGEVGPGNGLTIAIENVAGTRYTVYSSYNAFPVLPHLSHKALKFSLTDVCSCQSNLDDVLRQFTGPLPFPLH